LQVNETRAVPCAGTRMRCASRASTCSAASVACPQNRTSQNGVNQRRWKAVCGSRAGKGNAVSACLSSSAMRCSSAVCRSRASSTTAAGFPARARLEKASTT